MKKSTLLTAILFLIIFSTSAQWWGINKKYSWYSFGHSLSLSPIDNSVCVSGIFYGPYNSSPVPQGQGGFLMKYDLAGNLQWEKIYYSTYGSIKTINATDSKGNVWVTGHYPGDMQFENDSFGPLSGMFLIKYDSIGNLLFSYNEPRAKAYTIRIDQSDNILIAGYFNTNYDTVFYDRVFKKKTFIAKYDNEGNFLWVKYFFSQSSYATDYAFDMCLDGKGNIYSTGDFSQYGSYITDSIQLISTGSYDGFVAKYNSNAELQWVKTIKGDNMEAGRRIMVDLSGNIFIGGTIYSYQNSNLHYFDPITVVGDTLNGEDIFIAKYDSSGNCQWVTTEGGKSIDYINGLYVDNKSDVFIAGHFTGNSAVFGDTTFYSINGMEMYLTQYDSTGDLKWAGVSQGERGFANNITGNGRGDLFITGAFLTYWNFGPVSLVADDEHFEMFLIKLNSNSLDSFNIAPTDTVASSVKPFNNYSLFDIYPNPAKRSFTIRFSFGCAQDKSSFIKDELFLTIRNELGQIIYSESKTNFSGEYVNIIDLSTQPTGIYFVEMNCGEERRTKKIIIE